MSDEADVSITLQEQGEVEKSSWYTWRHGTLKASSLYLPIGDAQACAYYISDSCLIMYLTICKVVSSLSLEECKQIA